MDKYLIKSAIKTPDGTILESIHVHDYVTHKDANGEIYMLDGGLLYQRYNVCKEPFEDLSVWSDSPFEVIRENLYRGGYGKDGTGEYRRALLKDMSDDWVKNVITYEEIARPNNRYLQFYKKELEYRKENNIKIEE